MRTLLAIVFEQISFHMIKLTIGLLLITTSICLAQSLHDEIKMVYDFSPGKLTREEQNKKIPLMDDFWNKVKADTTRYLPELRTELQIVDNPKFFYFEGGQLLLSLSKSLKDKQIVLDGILKSDPSDIDRRALVSTLNYLAKSKLNTTEAALKILDDKEFKFFLPEHSFYFNQGYSLTYSLLPTNPNYYLSPLTNRFNEEQDLKTKKSIITFLWFANTCDGNEFLKKLTTDKTLDKEVADYTNDLLTRKLKKDKFYKELDKMTFDDLIKAQVASTNRMSDEAIYELDYITKLLRKNNCRQQ
jgi:hypothetical protein